MVTRSFNKDLEDELLSFIKREMLIPIIGSGFTVGCKANNGKVPSGQEMKEYMMGKLIETLDEDIKGDFSKIIRKSLESRKEELIKKGGNTII